MTDRSMRALLILGCVTRFLAAEGALAETTNLPPRVPGGESSAALVKRVAARPAAQVITSFLAPSNPAPAVTLAWDPSPSSNVMSYRVYYGAASAAYTNDATVVAAQRTNNMASITLSARGVRFYFAATAKDSKALESGFSNEVSYTPPAEPGPPAMRRVVVLVVESKTNLNDQWTDGGLPTYATDPDGPRRFWRLRIGAVGR
jgi:hypothetical protein